VARESPANLDIPDPTQFIKGYVFTASDGQTKVPLDVNDVFFLKTPNPQSLYRGMGIIQSIMTDIQSEKASSEWNRNFFINGGSAGDVIEVPTTMSTDDYERLKSEYRSGHEGVARAFRLLVLQGGAKYNPAKIGQKEMDFNALRGMNRDVILGAFGMPPIFSELRRPSTAQQRNPRNTFGPRRVCHPIKAESRQDNQFLLPQFPNSKGLWGRFEDPTPEDKAAELQKARDGFMSGFVTRNEARTSIGLNELATWAMYFWCRSIWFRR